MFLIVYRNGDRTIARFRISEERCNARHAFDLLSVGSGDPGEHMSQHNLDELDFDDQKQSGLLALSQAMDGDLFSESMELGLIALINCFIENDEGERLKLPSA